MICIRSLPRQLASLLVLLATGLAAAQPQAAPRPHIVHIVADDLGWADVGFNGAEDIKTPNIDALASEGVKLTQFYVQSMCTPTRAALLTGRYPIRYGLQTAVIPSVSSYGLDTEEWLLPQSLKEAGYHTAIVGKWHLGHADKSFWPRQRGFDYQYGAMIHRGQPRSLYPRPTQSPSNPNPHQLASKTFESTARFRFLRSPPRDAIG